MERQSTPEESIEDFMPRTGYSRDHGFSERPGDWETHSTYSGTGDNRGSEPVSQISYARSGDHAAYVAHQRWAERDSNRWQLNSRGDNIRDADDNFVPAADWQRNTVPVSNLVHEGSRVSFPPQFSTFPECTTNHRLHSEAVISTPLPEGYP